MLIPPRVGAIGQCLLLSDGLVLSSLAQSGFWHCANADFQILFLHGLQT